MWFGIFRIIVIILLKICFRLKVEGVENLPKKTNFIVVANHVSFLDPLLITAAIPKKIYWITMRSVYNVFGLRWIMKLAKALPSGNSSEKALGLLIKNKSVGLFPEGTRTYDGKLGEFRRGAALLAIKTGRPIAPCAILGVYEAFPRTAKFPKFLPIKVKIGKPIYLLKESSDEVVDDIFLQDGIFKIKNTIKEMIYAG